MTDAPGPWLRSEGEVWAVSFGGRVARLKDAKGLRYLAELLSRPGREVPVLDLVARVDGVSATRQPAEPGLVENADSGSVIDQRARDEYRQRLADLEAELDEAENFNDLARAERARTEIDFLTSELTSAFGLGGRARTATSDAERARVAVRRALKSTFDRIADVHPDLGRHLEATVRTGSYCSYNPDPRAPGWSIGDDAGPARTGLPTGVVTFLLTDIENSTPLWESYSAGMADALSRHDELIGRAVGAFRGHVVKSKGEGDSTLSVFGRASDGAAAAVAIQRALEGETWPPGVTIRVRMALHTGEAHERDGDYFGSTVNRAARLRSLAVGGQVVLSGATAEVVRELLPDETTLVPLGTHRLRGLTRVESVFALRGPGLSNEGLIAIVDQPDLPLPRPLRQLHPRFAGRAPELSRLEEAWRQMGDGLPRAVLIGGEPGIGKTALAAEFARRVHALGANVLFGRCEEDLDASYQPFSEAVRSYLAACDPVILRDSVIRPAAELARLVEPPMRSTAAALGTGGPDPGRLRLFDAIEEVLRRAASQGPIVVVLDDLHWATKPTLLLLGHLLRSSEAVAMLVIGTYRDTELDPTHPLSETLADLRRQPGAVRIHLDGLDLAETCELIEADIAGSLEDDARELASAAHERSQGNPFFALELFRSLTESGGGDDLPEGVREVVGRRLGRLPPVARRALAVAAVVGDRFSLRVLERVPEAAEDPAQLEEALESAVRSRLVEPTEAMDETSSFAFTHALVRETLQSELSGQRRGRLHRSIGDALESLPKGQASLDVLAYHYAADGVEDGGAKAAQYAMLAARDAMSRFAHDQAVAILERAIDVVSQLGDRIPGDQRAELLVVAARAHFLNLDLERCLDRATRASELALSRDLSSTWAEAQLFIARGRVLFDPEAVGRPLETAALEEFLTRTEGTDSTFRGEVLLYMAQLKFASFEFEVGLELAKAAQLLSARVGDDRSLAEADLARGLNHMGRLELGEAAEQFAAMGRRVPVSVDPLNEAGSRGRLGLIRLLQGELAEADAESAAACESTRLNGDWLDFSLFASCRAVVAVAEGRFSDAEVLGGQGSEAFQRSRYLFTPQVVYPALACGRALRGDDSGAGAALDEWEAVGGPGPWRHRLLCAALASGDVPPADAFSGLRAHRRDRPPDLFNIAALAAEAEIGDLVGVPDPVAGAYSRLVEARERGLVFCIGWTLFVPRLLGVAATVQGRYEEAEAWLKDAEALAARVSPVELARTRLAQVGLLVEMNQGSRTRAQELLALAAKSLDELDVVALQSRVARLADKVSALDA